MFVRCHTGTRWSLGFLPTQAILWYAMILESTYIAKICSTMLLCLIVLNLKCFFLLFLSLKIQVPLWMAGKTCGICGKYDAECEQEYRMPNGYLAKNAVSFGHSWILEEAPCRGGRQIALSSQHLIHQEIRWGLVITVAHHLSFEPRQPVKHFSTQAAPGN